MKDSMSAPTSAEPINPQTNGDQVDNGEGKPVNQEPMKGAGGQGEVLSPGGMKRIQPQQSPRGPGMDRQQQQGNGMMRMPRGMPPQGGPQQGGPQQGGAGQGWGPPPNQYQQNRPPMRNYNNEMGAAYGSYTGRGGFNNQGPESLSKTNLYIRGLTPNTLDQDLHNLCAQYGNIVSTKAIIDPVGGKCKGYGFVDFEHQADAEKATQALQTAGIQAQMAKVSKQEQDPTNLYIANLPDYVDENYLENMTRPFGTVVSTRILRDNCGHSRGVGFCRMETREMCEKIIHSMNKKSLPASQEPLLIKFADSGNKKKRDFRNQQMMGYDNGMHGGMPPQMMGGGNMNMRPGGYSIPGGNNQNQYMQGAGAGNWGMNAMYPQMAMSPVNPNSLPGSLPGSVDPNYLASQLSQMHLGQNFGMQQQQGYNQMNAAAQYGGPGSQGGLMPAQQQQMAPYDISTSPPQQLGGGIETSNDHFQQFSQAM